KRFFERAAASREAILLAREPPQRVSPRLAARRLRQPGGDLAFGVSQLPCFELQIADGAAPFIGRRRFERLLRLAQPLQRTVARRGRLRRVLASQIARGIPHFFGGVAHPPARVSPLSLALTAGSTLLTTLARPALRLPSVALAPRRRLLARI